MQFVLCVVGQFKEGDCLKWQEEVKGGIGVGAHLQMAGGACVHIYTCIFFSRGKIMEYIFDARICFSYHECSVFSCMRPYQGMTSVLCASHNHGGFLVCFVVLFVFFLGGWVC